jgi:ABC-type sugar transport system ATPase subunit
MELRYEQVCKRFGGVDALIDLNLGAPDGCFLAMLGPSGCGKTTALRLLAGLEEPTSGRMFIGPKDVTKLQPRERDIAMVFQSYALYPHKTVAENIDYPLRIRGHLSTPPAAIESKRSRACSTSSPISAATRASFRAASGSGWRSPERSSASPRPSSWTNRFPTSTRSCVFRCVQS